MMLTCRAAHAEGAEADAHGGAAGGSAAAGGAQAAVRQAAGGAQPLFGQAGNRQAQDVEPTAHSPAQAAQTLGCRCGPDARGLRGFTAETHLEDTCLVKQCVHQVDLSSNLLLHKVFIKSTVQMSDCCWGQLSISHG